MEMLDDWGWQDNKAPEDITVPQEDINTTRNTDYGNDMNASGELANLTLEQWDDYRVNLQGPNLSKAQALRVKGLVTSGVDEEEASNLTRVPYEWTQVDKSPAGREVIRGAWDYSVGMVGGAANMVGAEGIAAEAKEFVEENNNRDAFNNWYGAEYDPTTLKREKDWNVAGGIGEVALPMKAGFAIDKIAGTKLKSMAGNAAFCEIRINILRNPSLFNFFNIVKSSIILLNDLVSF